VTRRRGRLASPRKVGSPVDSLEDAVLSTGRLSRLCVEKPPIASEPSGQGGVNFNRMLAAIDATFVEGGVVATYTAWIRQGKITSVHIVPMWCNKSNERRRRRSRLKGLEELCVFRGAFFERQGGGLPTYSFPVYSSTNQPLPRLDGHLYHTSRFDGEHN